MLADLDPQSERALRAATERKRLNAMRMQQAASSGRLAKLVAKCSKSRRRRSQVEVCPQTASVAPSNSHTHTEIHTRTCLYVYLYVCVCRLQVFTISGARRRLYFALRGSTNIHTHTDASMRLFARVYACTHTRTQP